MNVASPERRCAAGRRGGFAILNGLQGESVSAATAGGFSMDLSAARRPIVAFAFMLALAGCSEGRRESPAAAPVPGPYLAMARGQVDVEGGLIRVAPARDGRIEEVRVGDGDSVRQGDVLARIDPRQAKIAVAAAEARLAQAEAQVGVLKAKLPQMQQQAKRLGEAAGAGAVTGQSADEAASALAVLQAEAVAAEAAVRLARQQVEEARAEVEARIIKAPAAGRIVRLDVHVGDVVSAQSASGLFELLPDRPRIVRAELNEAYVDLVKPGMVAEVVRDSGQGDAVSARVLRVGDVFGPSRLADDPLERAGAHDVECVLQLDGGEFRIGQRVLVRFKR